MYACMYGMMAHSMENEWHRSLSLAAMYMYHCFLPFCYIMYIIANVFGTAMKNEEESQKEEESRIGQDVWKS